MVQMGRVMDGIGDRAATAFFSAHAKHHINIQQTIVICAPVEIACHRRHPTVNAKLLADAHPRRVVQLFVAVPPPVNDETILKSRLFKTFHKLRIKRGHMARHLVVPHHDFADAFRNEHADQPDDVVLQVFLLRMRTALFALAPRFASLQRLVRPRIIRPDFVHLDVEIVDSMREIAFNDACIETFDKRARRRRRDAIADARRIAVRVFRAQFGLHAREECIVAEAVHIRDDVHAAFAAVIDDLFEEIGLRQRRQIIRLLPFAFHAAVPAKMVPCSQIAFAFHGNHQKFRRFRRTFKTAASPTTI